MAATGINRAAPEWAELATFLGAYLHQDFDAEYSEPWEAVLDYASTATGERKQGLASQVRLLLALVDDEDELEQTTDRLGMAYYPPGDGYSSYRYWLTAVAEHLEDPEAHPGPPERDAPLPGREGAGGRASTFTDRATAERAAAENLEANRAEVDAWLAGAGPNRAFEWQHDSWVGRLAPPDAGPDDIRDVDRSRVVLRANTEAPDGWFVLTSYPVATPDPGVAADIERTAPEWDALWTLFGGHLHQDFDIHGGVDGAVGTFEAEARPEDRAAAAGAVRRLLAGGDDEYLAAATEWLGLDYHPPGEGHTLRSWLTTLAGRLEA